MYYKVMSEISMNMGRIQDIDDENVDAVLIEGTLYDEQELNLPWIHRLTYKESRELILSDYYPSAKLMSKSMLDILKSSGVDNLQIFPAKIIDKNTGNIITSYSVVNIIGLVSCVNVDKSLSQPLAEFEYFDKLVIDESKVNGFKMFRLSESLLDVIVNEEVALALKEANLTNLSLEAVS